MFENADDLVIERRNARNHIAFGFGIHRCLGLRLAELQLRIVWQEILERFDTITVVDDPKWIYSNFVKGYETLPVRIAG
jgi:cytochrome P450